MKRSILTGLAALVLAVGCGPDSTSSGDRPDLRTGMETPVDMRLDGSKIDSGLDGYVNNDSSDGYVNNSDALDGGIDMVPQQHPIARLDNCTETDPMDGKCIYRMNTNQSFCWYGTNSTAPAGRNLVKYTIYLDGAFSVWSPNSKVCGGYTNPGKYSASLEVTDNTNDTGTQDFYNIVN